MKANKKFQFGFLMVIVFVAAFLVPQAFAQGLHQEAQPFDITGLLLNAVQFILGSATIAGAATFLVNILKTAGAVRDDQSLTWVSAINFVLILAAFLVKVFTPSFDLGIFERVSAVIVEHGPALLIPLTPILVWISKWIHGAVKGVAVFGKSFSLS